MSVLEATKRSHPWISFSLDLGRILREEPELAILLGEIQASCAHLSEVPLKPGIARELHELYLAKGVCASNAIEGNTLSEEEVRAVLSGTLKLPPSQEYLEQEVRNIASACEQILADVMTDRIARLTPSVICGFHEQVWRKLETEEHNTPGEFRRCSVGVQVVNYRGPDWRACHPLMENLCDWLDGEVPDEVVPGGRLLTGLLKAILAHLYIGWIHPFGDGNGRTARLVEFYFLVSSGFPSDAAHLLSNHYNQTRSEFYRNFALTSRSNSPVPFLRYAILGFRDQLNVQLATIQKHVIDIAWRDYVHERFRTERSDTGQRRRDLLLALGRTPWEFIPRGLLRNLTPDLAVCYANRGRKTVSRDLNWLEEKNLIVRNDDGGYRARVEEIFYFLPARKLDLNPEEVNANIELLRELDPISSAETPQLPLFE